MFSVDLNENEKKRKVNNTAPKLEFDDDLFLQPDSTTLGKPAIPPGFPKREKLYDEPNVNNFDFEKARLVLPEVDTVTVKREAPALIPDTASVAGESVPFKPKSAMDVLSAPYDRPGSSVNHFRAINPEATPERMMRNYSLSQEALETVADEYMEELQEIYKSKAAAVQNELLKVYKEYERNPHEALRRTQGMSDPMKIIESAVKDVDTAKLKKMVEPLARYGGFDPGHYVENFVIPTLHDNLVRSYVDKHKPKNSFEYIIRSAYNNSLLGKTTNLALGNDSYARLENEMLSSYDSSRLEDMLSGVGSLLIDAPAFKGFGALSKGVVGKATTMATNRLASRVYSYGAAQGTSKLHAAKVAERMIVGKLSTRIMQSAAMQGLTLGTYDVANSVADDVLYNDAVDFGKAGSSFLKGFTTGVATGTVGSYLGNKAKGLTGGKKMLASTGVLSAESAVFTLSTEAEKALHDVEIEPVDLLGDYVESFATLGIMKMTHWRPKGARNKLNAAGKIKEELQLSKSEQAELKELNIDPAQFMYEIEKSLKLPAYGAASGSADVIDNYKRMMQSKDVSATTKAKLMYLVENKLTSTPPVPFGYNVEKNKNGEWIYTTYDFNGSKIERRVFQTSSQVKDHLLVEKSTFRKNRIAAFERELLQGFESQNLLRQAGLYAKEKGIGIDDISHALYKRATNAELSGWENHIVREIVERSSYDETGMVQFLSDMRREIEKKYSLEDGALLVNIDEPFYKCTDAENKALNEYESLVRDEVVQLTKGADRQRAAELKELGEESRFAGMSNEEVKSKEVEDFYTRHPEKTDAVGNMNDPKPIKIDDDGTSGYVWSYNGVDNTVEDIARFEKEALKIAERFNLDLKLIRDEHEIPYPDVNDKYDVANYNNKLRAMGWLEKKGPVTINLPNIETREELEKTVVHEGVAHYGFAKLFGNYLNEFLEQVYRKASSEVRQGIDRIQAQYRFADNFTVVEEYLAKLTEKAALSINERRVLNGFKDFIRNSLVRLNIYTGRNRRITESDLMSLMRQHAKHVAKRTTPSKYRRWVFGQFDAAKHKEAGYHNREAYERDVRERMADGSFLRNTPDPLYNTKAFQHYELMPQEMKERFQKRWRATDEEIMNAKARIKYRFIGKKGADNRAYYDGYENGDPDLLRAIEYEKQGAPMETIKLYTGWERGADNEWRKEMHDGRLKVHDRLYKALARKDEKLADDYLDLKRVPMNAWGYDENRLWERIKGEGNEFLKDTKLRDVLYDPPFFAEYPELAGLPVSIVDNPKVPYRYNSRDKRIELDKSFFLYPENSVYMSGLLQNVIQDYEGFSKAVSMNLFGINSKLGKKYKDAQKLIDALDRSRGFIPDFDKNRAIDKLFEDEFGFSPEEFKKKFPSLDEYIIYKLTGKELSFSGDVEMRNVMDRVDAGEFIRRNIPAETTEDVSRSKQMPVKKISDLEKFFSGPLDIIYKRLQQLHSDEPLMLDKVRRRVRRADLSPLERSEFEWEMEDYAWEVLDRLMRMKETKNDFGYGKFKKKNDAKRKRLRDYLDYLGYKDLFEHMDLPDDLN